MYNNDNRSNVISVAYLLNVVTAFFLLYQSGASIPLALISGIIPIYNTFIIFSHTIGAIWFWIYLIVEVIVIILLAFRKILFGGLLFLADIILYIVVLIKGLFLII